MVKHVFRGLLMAIATAITLPYASAATLEELIPRIKPSIVAIGTYESTRNPRFAFRGTGFAVADGTLVATNAHVLPNTVDAQKLESLAVLLPAGSGTDLQRRDATLARVDREHDIAILRISGAPLPALVLTKKELPREGESAAFTGFPIGTVLGFVPVTHRATVGAITPIAIPMANARELDTRLVHRLQDGAFQVLQLDATAYPGNSGSPVYDADGNVIGIINMVFVKTTKEAVLAQPSGITFAVPALYLSRLLATKN